MKNREQIKNQLNQIIRWCVDFCVITKHTYTKKEQIKKLQEMNDDFGDWVHEK